MLFYQFSFNPILLHRNQIIHLEALEVWLPLLLVASVSAFSLFGSVNEEANKVANSEFNEAVELFEEEYLGHETDEDEYDENSSEEIDNEKEDIETEALDADDEYYYGYYY